MRINKFLKKLNTSARWRLFNPKPPKIKDSEEELMRLGSNYGGKTVVLSLLNANSVVVSAGAGEDISFEIEIQAYLGCRMYILDPTPASVTHFAKILERGTAPRISSYSQGPVQKIESYDTQKLNLSLINFYAKALWKSESKLKFFPPIFDERDGSYSISSIQNNYQKTKKFIYVDSTTLPTLMKNENLERIDYLKLDIEGAVLEVLRETFSKKIYPRQINLEIDEMHFPGLISYLRTWKLRKLLQSNDYKCVHRENCDFLFMGMHNTK